MGREMVYPQLSMGREPGGVLLLSSLVSFSSGIFMASGHRGLDHSESVNKGLNVLSAWWRFITDGNAKQVVSAALPEAIAYSRHPQSRGVRRGPLPARVKEAH